MLFNTVLSCCVHCSEQFTTQNVCCTLCTNTLNYWVMEGGRDGLGGRLAGAAKQVDTNPCSNTNPRLILLGLYKLVAGQDEPLFSSRWGRLDQFNLRAATNCSICVLCFPSKGRSLTTATGRAAVGSLHVRMSSHATTGNTRATDRFSVRNATGPSRGQTTLLSIWRDTYETLPTEWRLKKKQMLAEPWTNLWPTHFLKTIICLQATRQAVVFHGKKERYSYKSLEFFSWRPIPSLHVVQVTRRDLSVRVVNFYERDQTGICLIWPTKLGGPGANSF